MFRHIFVLICVSFTTSLYATHPTSWHLNNTSSQKETLSCRTYSKGWSYINGREFYKNVPSHTEIKHQFSDHNDGLGMLDREWSCALGSLQDPSSTVAQYHGDDQTWIVMPDDFKQTDHWIEEENIHDNVQYCPSINAIVRTYDCGSSGCGWDRYRSDLWEGIYQPLSTTELKSFQFAGVDASEDMQEVYGCIYTSQKFQKNLILTAFEMQGSGQFPKNIFKPAIARSHWKETGYLRQCLSSKQSHCPITRR